MICRSLSLDSVFSRFNTEEKLFNLVGYFFHFLFFVRRPFPLESIICSTSTEDETTMCQQQNCALVLLQKLHISWMPDGREKHAFMTRKTNIVSSFAFVWLLLLLRFYCSSTDVFFSFFLPIFVLWCFFEILRLFITEFAVCSCLYSHPGGMFCARAAIMLSWKNVFAMCFVFVSITIMGGKGSSGGKDGDSNRRRDGGRDVKRAEKA